MLNPHKIRIATSVSCVLLAAVVGFYDYFPSVIIKGDVDFNENQQVDSEVLADEDMDEEASQETLLKETPNERSIQATVGRGDSLATILKSKKIPAQVTLQLAKALKPIYSVKSLKPGVELTMNLKRQDNTQDEYLQELRVRPAQDYVVIVSRDEKGNYTAIRKNHKLEETKKIAEAVIVGSLYDSMAEFKVPARIINKVIKSFSYSIDFQRGIKSGDTFSVMYSIKKDLETGYEKTGQLLFAEIKNKGRAYQIYRFQPKGCAENFYTNKGEGIKRGLLQTPVNGARISSRFGRRRHPILGYTKHHSGVDFACPRGTPIKASGNGVVEAKGRLGGYGNYVRIRHGNGYKTAYAHMHRYAKGLRKGQAVKQGQVIGYVGTTGRSTGPHLHYEVITAGNRKINPLSVKMMPAVKLNRKEMKSFNATKKTADQTYAKLRKSTALAMADKPEKNS